MVCQVNNLHPHSKPFYMIFDRLFKASLFGYKTNYKPRQNLVIITKCLLFVQVLFGTMVQP